MNTDMKTVLVDGASGYLGLHAVKALIDRGYAVRALVRPQSRPVDRATLESLGAEVCIAQLKLEQSDTANDAALTAAFAGVSYGLHLIGSIAPRRGETFQGLHPQMASVFASCALKAGLERVVMVTALGADRESQSLYLKSKALAEEAARAQLAESLTVLRPSLIVGRQVGTRDSKLVKRYLEIAASRPFIPLIDGGHNLIEPVYVGDLALAIVETFARADLAGTTLEIGGAEKLTMRSFVERLLAVVGKTKPFLPLPYKLASVLASISEKISDVPILSSDQAYLATIDNVTQNNVLSQLTEVTPLNLALSSYRAYAGKVNNETIDPHKGSRR